MLPEMPERPPEDLVPPTGLDLETLRVLDQMAGKEVTWSSGGEILLDPDGVPIGVGETTTSFATLSGCTFTRAELDRLGGRPSDFPHLTFIDTEGDQQHDHE